MSDLSAFDLSGRRIVVTGAGTGIGQGMTLSLIRAGAEVVGVDLMEMDETASLVAKMGGSFAPFAANLGDRGTALSLIDTLSKKFGPLDGLCNNAGIIRREDSENLSEKDWDEVVAINMTAVFLLSQAFGRTLLTKGRKGKIVNTASLLSFQGGIRVASYTASKHGVAGITKILANEWAAKGINVNAIAPGYIATNNTAALRADPKRSAEILGRIPAGRWGVPSDIGDTAAFLMAPASDYIHGIIVPVDGGWLAR
jgi:2-dehydro-3-deoxy-D-gluconate 5-dehydrogenase